MSKSRVAGSRQGEICGCRTFGLDNLGQITAKCRSRSNLRRDTFVPRFAQGSSAAWSGQTCSHEYAGRLCLMPAVFDIYSACCCWNLQFGFDMRVSKKIQVEQIHWCNRYSQYSQCRYTNYIDIWRIYVSIEIYMQPHTYTHILIFKDEHTLYTDAFLSCRIACLSDLQATVSRMTSAPSEVQVPRICLAYIIGNQFQGPSNRTWTDSDNYDLRHSESNTCHQLRFTN